MFKYLTAFCIVIVCCIPRLQASDALSEGGLFLVYGDSNLSAVSSFVKKELKSQLRDAGIKIDAKSKKGQTLSDLIESLDKEVIKKKPALVLLQLSVLDWYDSKAKKLSDDALEFDIVEKYLRDFVLRCQNNEIAVAIATPGLAGENLAEDRAINGRLDKVAEQVRALCKELDVDCCDYRSLAVKHLQANNPKRKSKGILTKDGMKISKDGSAVLAPCIQKILGMSKNGIGKALGPQDQIRFFEHGFFRYTKIEKKANDALLAKFPDVAGPVKPSFKFVNVQDITYAKEAPSSQITNHNARVSFVYIGHRMQDVPRHKFAIFQDIHTQICKDLKQKTTGTVYLVTLPPVNRDPEDGLNKLRIRQNEVIRNNAIDYGFNLLDLHKIVSDKYASDPMFKIMIPGDNFTPPTAAFEAICVNEIFNILGLPVE